MKTIKELKSLELIRLRNRFMPDGDIDNIQKLENYIKVLNYEIKYRYKRYSALEALFDASIYKTEFSDIIDLKDNRRLNNHYDKKIFDLMNYDDKIIDLLEDEFEDAINQLETLKETKLIA